MNLKEFDESAASSPCVFHLKGKGKHLRFPEENIETVFFSLFILAVVVSAI